MKQKFSKILALICALALTLSLTVPAFAADKEPADKEEKEPVLTVAAGTVNNDPAFDTKTNTLTLSTKYGETEPESHRFLIALLLCDPDTGKAVTDANGNAIIQKGIVKAVNGDTSSCTEVRFYGNLLDMNDEAAFFNVTTSGLYIQVKPKSNVKIGEHEYTFSFSPVDETNGTEGEPLEVKVKLTVNKGDALEKEDTKTDEVKLAKPNGSEGKFVINKDNQEEGLSVVTGAVTFTEDAKKKFPQGEDSKAPSIVYAVTTEKTADKIKEWEDSLDALKVHQKGTYYIYYKIMGGSNYADSEPILLTGDYEKGIEVSDSSLTITLNPGTESGFAEGTKTTFTTDLEGICTVPGSVYNKANDKKVEKWVTKDADGKDIDVDFSKAFTENTTIYAVWSKEKLAIGEVVLKCESEGKFVGEATCKVEEILGEDGETVEHRYLIGKVNIADPTLTGKVFQGWTATKDGDDFVLSGTEVTDGQTVYAKWENEPEKPSKPSTPDHSGSTGTPGIGGGSSVTPSQPTEPTTPGTPSAAELAKENWTVSGGKFTHKDADGKNSTGSRWIESNGVGHRYIFGTDGVLQTGKASAAGTVVTAAGEILMNGNLYYLNPDRNVNDPRTCYVMTDYLQIRDNYAGQTYFDKDGITFQGWMKTPEGGLRYQTRIARPGQPTDLYLIVWRVQDLPACQHPDHPGDPAYNLPAGRYFFDDEGVLVQKEGWNDGKDGKEYYTNAKGMVTQERAK